MVIAGFSLMTMLLILLAGIGAGFVGYAVGASSLVSYPALLALGIPPVLANASNTVGVIGTGIGGVLGARKELRGQRLRSITYVSIGAVGGVAGAALLLSLDPKIFEFAVPPLILFSSLIIAVNPRGRMQARQAAADVMAQARSLTTPQGQGSDGAPASAPASTQPMSKDPWWIWLGVAFVAVYSGYFGAGAGTCALAVLDAGKIRSVPSDQCAQDADRHRCEHQRVGHLHRARRRGLACGHPAVRRLLHRRIHSVARHSQDPGPDHAHRGCARRHRTHR